MNIIFCIISSATVITLMFVLLAADVMMENKINNKIQKLEKMTVEMEGLLAECKREAFLKQMAK